MQVGGLHLGPGNLCFSITCFFGSSGTQTQGFARAFSLNYVFISYNSLIVKSLQSGTIEMSVNFNLSVEEYGVHRQQLDMEVRGQLAVLDSLCGWGLNPGRHQVWC